MEQGTCIFMAVIFKVQGTKDKSEPSKSHRIWKHFRKIPHQPVWLLDKEDSHKRSTAAIKNDRSWQCCAPWPATGSNHVDALYSSKSMSFKILLAYS